MVLDPASIPQIEGDMDALGEHARGISAFGVAFADTGARLHATWQQLAAVYHAPEADQLLLAMLPVQHVTAAVGEDHETVGAAVLTYSDTVRPIQQRLLRSAVDSAVAEFQAAERVCANAIAAVSGGPQYRVHDGDGRQEAGEYGYSAQQLAQGMGARPGHPWGTAVGTDPGVLAFLLAGIRAMLTGTSILPSPPADGSPADNAAWWAVLPPGVQQALLVTSPALVGNLAGLPAWARDRANRSRLRGAATRVKGEIAGLEGRIARLQAGLAPHRSAPGFEVGYYDELRQLEQLQAQREQLQDKRASLDAIERTLDKPGQRQLLLLDLSGDRAEAAVAVGDVDTAEHVAVFTPGYTSTVDGSLEGYDTQMRQLREQAYRRSRQFGDGGEVATVTWIGYQAPQEPGEVVGAGHAEAGADTLAETVRGIDASRPDDPHLTAIGHSYGSTTTGLAVQQPGTGVDDVVFMGSPGIGTSDIDDLRVPQGHAYVVEARGDYVADFGRFGSDPNMMEGVTGLSAREETVDGRRLNESTGHSGYLASDSSSQYNISTVVAGVPERAVHDRGVGAGDVLRGGGLLGPHW
jgi:hypothetical protein